MISDHLAGIEQFEADIRTWIATTERKLLNELEQGSMMMG